VLWPDLKLARDAFASCDKKALAVVALPFETRWYTMDNDGMKDRSLKYRSATALATACKKHKLHGVTGMKLEAPRVNSASPTQLEVSEDGAVWDVQFHAGHWRVHAAGEGG
jgi:hypothetical protein